MKTRAMPLGRVTGKIPSGQHVLVRDYLSGSHYAIGAVEDVIAKSLDYRMELREAAVYGISIEGNNIICIDVLIEE